MAAKETIRPIYEELQGYLQQGATADAYNHGLWQSYHRTIALLSELSGEDFSRFRVTVIPHSTYQHVPLAEHIDPTEYRAKLAGLVRYLHGKYFPNEAYPVGLGPLIVVRQTQHPSAPQQMMMEITAQLARCETLFEQGGRERGFIDKVRGLPPSTLSGIASVSQLLLLLLGTAEESGLNLDDLQRILGK
jgi:hypothetical protein